MSRWRHSVFASGLVALLCGCGSHGAAKINASPGPSARAVSNTFVHAVFTGDTATAQSLMSPDSSFAGSYLDDWSRGARRKHFRTEGAITRSGGNFSVRYVGSYSNGVSHITTTGGKLYGTARACATDKGRFEMTLVETSRGWRVREFNPRDQNVSETMLPQKGPGPNRIRCPR